MFVNIVIFIIGLCCGSFVNMLVYRTEQRYKIRKTLNSKLKNKNENRSYCDFCGRQLRWYENIPVVSWIILNGKSSCCHKKLPIQYPLVELLTGFLFVISPNYIWMIITTLLVFAAVFDIKHMILPDFSTYILIGIATIFFHNWIAGIGSFLFLLILHVATKGKGMGLGDVKLALFMGLMLGWPKIVLAYYIAFIGGALVGLVLIIWKKRKKNSQIAFGPFLIAGTILSYLIGDKLLYYVYRWF